jgi:hypothetical protein
VLLLDEVDIIVDKADYRDDFFSTVRYWHSQLAMHPEPWDRLNLVIAHWTEPSLWIRDIHRSPFNVGERCHLQDFNAAQVADLNDRYRTRLSDVELPGLMALVGGHPFLVRQALYCLARDHWSLAELKRRAGESDGPFGDHLKRYVLSLCQDQPLRDAFKSVLDAKGLLDENHFQRLKSAGLICGAERAEAAPRCQLYADYFRRHL